MLTGNGNDYWSFLFCSFSNKNSEILRDDDDNDDDAEIITKVTFKDIFVSLLSCAVRHITRIWFNLLTVFFERKFPFQFISFNLRVKTCLLSGCQIHVKSLSTKHTHML
jgi:hypothetical protein